MDILRGAAAPYFLTLIVSVFSWIFLEIKKETADVAIIRYEERINSEKDDVTEELIISNLSERTNLKDAKIDLVCPSEKACFKKSSTIGGYAVNKFGEPWNIALNPTASENQVSFALNLPPNASATIVMSLVSHEIKPVFGFSYMNMTVENTPVIFSNDNIIYTFMAVWYRAIIIYILVASLILLSIYVVVSFFKIFFGKKKAEMEPSQLSIPIILADGKTANFEILLNVRKGIE